MLINSGKLVMIKRAVVLIYIRRQIKERLHQAVLQAQAQAQVFVLFPGGAEGTITLNSAANEANFVSSLTGLINEWGGRVDGTVNTKSASV